MELDLEKIEDEFQLYLDKNEKNIRPYHFQLIFIRLLLLFSNELSNLELKGILERQKQINNNEYKNETINELRIDSRKTLNVYLRNNERLSKKALLNRLIFGSLIDTDDNDLYSFMEVLFLFLSVVNVPLPELKIILEHEFSGLEI